MLVWSELTKGEPLAGLQRRQDFLCLVLAVVPPLGVYFGEARELDHAAGGSEAELADGDLHGGLIEDGRGHLA